MTVEFKPAGGATLHLGGDAYAHAELESLVRPLYDGEGEQIVQRHPDNPRRGDTAAIVESIRKNGIYRAVIAQRSTGYVIAGNHTLDAAIDQGAERLPVTYVDVDDESARRIMLADNRTADLGHYNDELLRDILADIGDLTGTGYSQEDLDDLDAMLQERPPIDGDGTRISHTFMEDGEAYADRAQRLLVLTLAPPPYAWLVGALERLAAQQGNPKQSNTLTILHLAAEALGEEIPASLLKGVE